VSTLVLLCFTQNPQQLPSLSLLLALNIQMHKQQCRNEPQPLGLNLVPGHCVGAFKLSLVSVCEFFCCVAINIGIYITTMWAMGPLCKVLPLIGFSDGQFKKKFGEVRKMAIPLRVCEHPELDDTPFCSEAEHKQHQHIIGVCQWLVVAGRFDINYAVSLLSCFSIAPCSTPWSS